MAWNYLYGVAKPTAKEGAFGVRIDKFAGKSEPHRNTRKFILPKGIISTAEPEYNRNRSSAETENAVSSEKGYFNADRRHRHVGTFGGNLQEIQTITKKPICYVSKRITKRKRNVKKE